MSGWGDEMSDEYLWDRSGPPDPEVERLERALGRLRSTAPVPDFSAIGSRAAPSTRYVGWRFLAPALAAAATIALMAGAAWQTPPAAASWPVARLSGTPRIGLRGVSDASRLAVGETLATDAASSARVDVSTVGVVTIGENTRVRLVDGVYTLRVDEDGGGLLSVAAGWVAFEDKGRESFVPAGASSRTYPQIGPGTPSYDDADAAFQQALETVDVERNVERRGAALGAVLARARARDGMTLWHLIPRVSAGERGAVVDALAARAPMPAGVTRDGVMRLDRGALDRWWDALGLLDTGWWRRWKVEIKN